MQLEVLEFRINNWKILEKSHIQKTEPLIKQLIFKERSHHDF